MARSLTRSALVAKLPACEVRTSENLDRDENFDGLPVRGFLWTLFAFKMATVAVIFWAAGGSSEASILLSATTWPWLIIPGIVLFGWLAFHFRLRRVRARRRELQQAEWLVDEHETIAVGVRPNELDV